MHVLLIFIITLSLNSTDIWSLFKIRLVEGCRIFSYTPISNILIYNILLYLIEYIYGGYITMVEPSNSNSLLIDLLQ